MKTELRLNSTVRNGVGGPETGAISLIYMYLFAKFSLLDYRYIGINQIGEEPNDWVLRDGKDINVNIRYPTVEDFDNKSTAEKNLIRLDVIHSALIRIAKKEKKLDIPKLEAIRNLIIEKNFSFDLILKAFINKYNKKLVVKLIVHPKIDRFDFFVEIEDDGRPICKTQVYSGMTTYFYFPDFFNVGRWANSKELIITGKKEEVEIHVLVDECVIKYVNLTSYPKPPTFEMFRSGLSAEDREQARQDWLNSLPPHIRAAISFEPN